MEYDFNNWVQVLYDLQSAFDNGVKGHSEDVMKNLGFEIIDSIPQSIGDCWWFTVKKNNNPLPPYLSKMEYNFNYWHNC